jgi:polyhydroxybutyrate depolymerase
MFRAIRVALAPLVIGAALAARAAADDEQGFVPIFDGRSLAGWLGQDMSFWSVEDGAITGTITPEHAPPMNQYLVYQGGLVDDFELELEFRLTGSATPNTNGGFQFRSRRLPDGDVAGYQVDNNFGQPWKVRLYDEFGRHDLALEGQRTQFDAQGRKYIEPLPLEAGAADFRLDQWHKYHLVADGPNLSLAVNGRLVAACTDDDPQQFEPLGVLAMQLHTGPPMKAQFRNLRLKRIERAQPLSARQQLMATAALDWQLGRRTTAHQPPLAPQGKITAGLSSQGPAARRDAAVAELEEAWFDAGKAWNTPADAITVYLRARVPDGNWSHALFSKRGGPDRVHFNLFGADLPGRPGTDIGFEIRTEAGLFQTTFPVSKIDARAWHDLVGRYDGASLEILCDGVVVARSQARGKLVPNDEPMLVGGETDDGRVVRPFSGRMEEAALWTRALSDDEIGVVIRSDQRAPKAAAARLGPGDHERTLTVDGRQRSYIVHVPPGYDAETPTPVVLVFHAAGMNARLMILFCQMHKKSDEAGFVAVYPNGTGAANLFLTFNAGGVATKGPNRRPDDVRFTAALVDDLAQVVNVDAKRLYATGLSNGAIMCYTLAAELSDRIAAIAPVAGAATTKEIHPSRPVPVLHFHGTADTFVPPAGPGEKTPRFLSFLSLDESLRIWTRHNGCPDEPTVTQLPDAADDGTRVTRKVFGPGTNGAEVVLYLIEGGGHTWPGQKSPLALVGKSTADISANDLIWEFFQKHALQKSP